MTSWCGTAQRVFSKDLSQGSNAPRVFYHLLQREACANQQQPPVVRGVEARPFFLFRGIFYATAHAISSRVHPGSMAMRLLIHHTYVSLLLTYKYVFTPCCTGILLLLNLVYRFWSDSFGCRRRRLSANGSSILCSSRPNGCGARRSTPQGRRYSHFGAAHLRNRAGSARVDFWLFVPQRRFGYRLLDLHGESYNGTHKCVH